MSRRFCCSLFSSLLLFSSCVPPAEVLEWVDSVDLRVQMSTESEGWVHEFSPVLVREEYVVPSFAFNPVPVREEANALPRGGKVQLKSEEANALSEQELKGLAYAKLTDRMNELETIDWSMGWRSAKAVLEARGISPVEFVIGWVQDMPYQGGNTYEKHAVETFLDREGDCSDKTMLAMDVLHRMGYKVGIVVFEEVEHMGLAMACEPPSLAPIPASYLPSNERGAGWMYIECTSRSAWGEIPSVFANGELMRGGGRLFLPAGPVGEACSICNEVVQWQRELEQEYGEGVLSMSLEDRRWWGDIQAMADRIEILREGAANLRVERDEWLIKARAKGCVEDMTVVSHTNECSGMVENLTKANIEYNHQVNELNRLVAKYNDEIARWNQLMKR